MIGLQAKRIRNISASLDLFYLHKQSVASSGNGSGGELTVTNEDNKQRCLQAKLLYQTLLGKCEEAGRRHSQWKLAVEVVKPLASECTGWSGERIMSKVPKETVHRGSNWIQLKKEDVCSVVY
ncbi:hypothetical protein PoB_003991600 [Plakobranchus ocellatus]|uniref:Uncharacterized protein n=1 Tax=Plakobranchus ocellatus TaxID=259542 RepID=A0AAV4B3L6_9GAST|nr:hypothetical protein PoB_003991600 [Plakobranchus ocellatus]